MRRTILAVLSSFAILASAFAQETLGKFRISKVEYELDGTKESAVRRNIPISTKRVFGSREELDTYIADLRKRFQNERIFQETKIEYETGETEEVGDSGEKINLVKVSVLAKDSKSLLILPYPKYSSSDGFSAKLKMKDANFLGTMSELSADAYFSMKTDEDDENTTHKAVGIDFEYDFPFQAGPFNASWNNDYFFEYTLDTKEAEFDTRTGLTLELPLDTYSLVLDVSQSVVRDNEFEFYGDEFHFSTEAKLSMPIKVAEIDNWGDIKWTPYADYTVNYRQDGEIDSEDIDLSSPLLTFAHEASTGRVDWNGNFRNGLKATAGQSISYNFQRREYDPKIHAEIQAFKSAKRIGLAARLFAFACYARYEKIGERIRGAIDEQKYRASREMALKVPSAVVLNVDLPIHIVTTDWNGWTGSVFGQDSWIARHTAWFRHFDFEMQISPFIDIALTKNAATGSTFAIKDGWYTGGIEVLVFPKRWRSVVVRGSIGFDLGRKMLEKIAPGSFDESWRKDVSEKEVYIGIGLFY